MSRMDERDGRHRAEEWDERAAVERALRSPGAGIIGGRSAPADARSLRGIPMIGGECGGAIPGTVPHRQRRLDYWQPKRRTE